MEKLIDQILSVKSVNDLTKIATLAMKVADVRNSFKESAIIDELGVEIFFSVQKPKKEADEPQGNYILKLKGYKDGRKIPLIKAVRDATGLGLKEVKEIVEALHFVTIFNNISLEEAESYRAKLLSAGARDTLIIYNSPA